MGILNDIYAISDVVILGGAFEKLVDTILLSQHFLIVK